MKGIYDYKVHSLEVDFQKNLAIDYVGNYLLTTAAKNADSNGFGLHLLQQRNASWVLTKIAIEMNEALTEDQAFSIETWVEEVGRLQTTRNFNIYNTSRQIIGSACSNWIMFDMTSRKAVDLLSIEGLLDVVEKDSGLIEKPIRLTSVTGTKVDEFKVKYSDIDINGHVYSMRYLQWLCNLFPLDKYKVQQIQRVELNFINETLWGENVAIYQEEKRKDDFWYEIKSEDKILCKARIFWKENHS
jgi:acyl-ACP thioesterase